MDTKTLRAKVTKFLTANPQPEVIEVVEVAEPVNEVKEAFNSNTPIYYSYYGTKITGTMVIAGDVLEVNEKFVVIKTSDKKVVQILRKDFDLNKVTEPVNEVKAAFNLEEDENPFLKDSLQSGTKKRKRKPFNFEPKTEGLTAEQIEILQDSSQSKKGKIRKFLALGFDSKRVSEVIGVKHSYILRTINPRKRKPKPLKESRELDMARVIMHNKGLSKKTEKMDFEKYFDSSVQEHLWDDVSVKKTKKLFLALSKR
jgi:hypothetical protein